MATRLLFLPAGFLFLACSVAPPKDRPERPAYERDMGGYPAAVEQEPQGSSQVGMISFYGDGFHGRKTASGARFDKHALTAAHRSLPFGTRLKVTNLSNGKSVTVTVNDRGPFAHGRILDLSEAAARAIGMIGKGTVKARLEVL